MPYAGRFDGFHAVPASVSKTCLVRFDNNRYSVAASALGRPVEVRAYADRIEVRQDGRIVGDHPRAFGRDQTVFESMALRAGPGQEAWSPAERGARSRTGFCRAASTESVASSPASTTAIGRWSRS